MQELVLVDRGTELPVIHKKEKEQNRIPRQKEFQLGSRSHSNVGPADEHHDLDEL